MIELQGVRIDHPRTGEPMLRQLDVRVDLGQLVAIHAPPGAGATRLMASLTGEFPIDEGGLTVLGRDLQRLRRSDLRLLRRRLGVIPQELHLLADRNALLNVTLPLEIDGVPRQAAMVRAAELLSALNMAGEAELPLPYLPQSLAQRVAVARAMVRRPQVVLADQPTNRQDDEGAELIFTLLSEAASTGAACVVFSQDPRLLNRAGAGGWSVLSLVDGRIAGTEAVEASTQPAVSASAGIRRPQVHSTPSVPSVVAFPQPVRVAEAG